jgi:protein-S-isoprenylcysteine O-methyltransferase Ste14
MQTLRAALTWFGRTPVQSFLVCPVVVLAVEIALHGGHPVFVPWGLPLMAWGYLQYRQVGNWRHPRAGGSRGIDVLPDRIISTGIYRYTRNPMYLGHLIFLTGLAVTLWSWFALILLAVRAVWFHCRVLGDERRLEAQFGADYTTYCRRVPRWIPGLI